MDKNNITKKIELRILENGNQEYFVVMRPELEPEERKISERRTRNADVMAKTLFGNQIKN